MLELLRQNAALIALAAAVLALAALALVAGLLARQSRRLRRDRERLAMQLRHDSELQGRNVDQLGRSVTDSLKQLSALSGTLDALTRRNDRQLEEMRREVGEKLDGRLSESFRVVNGQLADVHRGIGEMRELAANVTDLKKLLGNVKTRGVWGEALLRNLMCELFAPDQYLENAAIPEGSATRVEFALKLPGRDGDCALLPIDSKFPQEDYLRLVDAEAARDADAAQKCARMLERAVLEQARTIADKYIRVPQTADFAVMFLPSEGLYAEAARIPGLIERAQTKHRVLIAGPATLCALLTSLQMGLRSSALEKRSGEALALLDELRGELARLLEGLARTRQKLDLAGSELDAVESRARRISKKLP